MNRFSIRARVSAGSSVMIALLILAVVFAYFTARSLAETYQSYQATAKQTVAINNYVEDLSEARIAALKFRLVPSDSTAAEVSSNIAEILSDAADLSVFDGHPETAQEVTEIADLALQYLEGFTLYQRTFDQHVTTKDAAMEGAQRIRANAAELEKLAYQNNDTELTFLSAQLRESFLLTQLDLQDYLFFEDLAMIEAARGHLDDTRGFARQIDDYLDQSGVAANDSRLHEILVALETEIERFGARVDVLQQSIQQLMATRNGTLDRIGPVMQARLEAVAETIIARQGELGPQGQALVDRVKQITPIFGVLATAISLIVAWLVGQWIARPLAHLANTTEELAKGNTDVEITGAAYQTEIGRMARSLDVFREAHISRQELAAAQDQAKIEQQQVVDTLSVALEGLASGNLRARIDQVFPDNYEGLRQDFNRAVTNLETAIGSVTAASRQIDGTAETIRNASLDMSHRTENQAATLEETAAALDTLTDNVRSSAGKAKEVETTVELAHNEARESGKVVADAIAAMQKIKDSSTEISNITSLIADIAFQTNLLALNAGVEAARAGEYGRGFAVVASEVRALAQRSSEAAKQVSDLISKSAHDVTEGTTLVEGAGTALTEIIQRVETITDLVTAIAASSSEQAQGISEINIGVTQLDRVTQENAGMVEQSTGQCDDLANQARGLAQLVQQFELSLHDSAEDLSFATAEQEALAS